MVLLDEQQQALQELTLYLGEARTLPVPNLARVAVGRGAVLNAVPIDGREVLMFGESLGVSSLSVWDRRGRQATLKVNVVRSDTPRVLREVASFVQNMPRVRASVVGDKVIIDGDDLSDADLERIALISQQYPQVVNFAGRVGWEKMIRLSVRVIELPTTEVENLGVRWGGEAGQTTGGLNLGIASDLISSGRMSSRPGESPIAMPFPVRRPHGYFGVNALLSSQINLLAAEGRAVVLAEPTLSTRSGSPASFLAGGEIAYSLASSTGTPSVMFKQYGVKLDITPRVDARTGTIRSTIDTEISDIDPTISTAAGPALLTRRVRSEFNVREGETMVLSGFIQHRRSKDVQKVPGLGDVPVVGSLFRSRTFLDRETQLLLLVTPVTVDAQSEAVRRDIERGNAIVEQEIAAPRREQARSQSDARARQAQPSAPEARLPSDHGPNAPYGP